MWTTAYCCSSGREGGTDTPAGHGSLQTHTVTLAHTHTYTRSSVIILSSISTHSEAGGGHAGAGSAVETVSLNIFSSSDGEDGDCFFFPSPLPSSPLSSFTTILRIMVQWWMCGEDMFYSQHGLPVMQLDRDDQVRIKNSKYGGAAEEGLSCFFFFLFFSMIVLSVRVRQTGACAASRGATEREGEKKQCVDGLLC